MSMKLPVHCDPSDYLAYCKAMLPIVKCFNDGGPKVIVAALGGSARTKGMAEIPRDASLDRESLYKALLNGGHPELDIVLRATSAPGLQ
jgi:probable addiction module antidote protein